ncbi:hypothetical protein [Blastococcus sp. URHD0036]|uniref:hypothetical protein n=1 Tax=Blastococcus sp. URHD0036 TaxID=1380356 RepID=UPI000497BEF0|nr:hypothetical protein [Blastococcus sp. URHD0036]
MTRRRRSLPGAPLPALLAVLGLLASAGCSSGDGEGTDAAPTSTAGSEAVPETPEELAALLVTEVPSGLVRVADDDVDPPAGPKTVEDVAGYADDPGYERQVLEDYGYRFGWERFWGTPGGTVTSVFVDEFDGAPAAAAYAEDLAADGADYYAGMLQHGPPGLPRGCRLLTVAHPDPETRLTGPAAFAWCGSGVFSVAVSAVTGTPGGSVEAATDEVAAVVAEQLARLPD